ncbi:MAG: cardiolipin synthase [Clostridia bacterium]|nr:cardiolipin synthase [Clostridia bacterium]
MRSTVKNIYKPIISRTLIIVLLLLVQILAMVLVVLRFSDRFLWYSGLSNILALLTVFTILRGNANPAYKLSWIVVILVLPIFGLLCYLIFGNRKLGRAATKKMEDLTARAARNYFRKNAVLPYLAAGDATGAAQSRYLENCAAYPLFRSTESRYLSSGEAYFAALVEELSRARSFIFLEYFIIGEGYMWDTVLSILREKAEAGLDVRLIYDDFGCLASLPHNFARKISDSGIRTMVFNPVMPVLNSGLNNRDHRKICVIDGNVGFTGGINLADEYINRKRRFGHWKDTGIMLRGDGVWGLTVMFLTMWSYLSGRIEPFEDFRPSINCSEAEGFVQPYADSPLDSEHVGEMAYMNMICSAKRYIYITTPYLVLDNEMRTALIGAAKRGVDVRIMTPGIPDKRYVFAVTRANYEPLVEAGIRIYEYAPGFLHAKSFVCDDRYAIVGTVNMDFRSFYLHFECATLLLHTKSVLDVRDDFLETRRQCREITKDRLKSQGLLKRLVQSFLSLFAPMM